MSDKLKDILSHLSTEVDQETLLKYLEGRLSEEQKHELEKKMLRAEKKRFETQARQIHQLKEKLFPQNNLQERVDNMAVYYALYGKELLGTILENSLSLEANFAVLTLN